MDILSILSIIVTLLVAIQTIFQGFFLVRLYSLSERITRIEEIHLHCANNPSGVIQAM
jgi:hypothetical protein